MRIAYVVHDYGRTIGHSRYVVALTERLCRAHEIHVYANRFLEAVPAGVAAHHVRAWRASALASILTFPLSAGRAIRRPFDVVHAQGVVVPHANVVTAHICNASWLAHRRAVMNGHLGWKERLFGRLVIPLERHLYRSGQNTVIAISEAIRRDLERYYGREGDTMVIHHGVDRQQFHPGVRQRFRQDVRARLGLSADEPVFLFVGDLRKGAALVIEALSHVPGHLVLVSQSNPDSWLTHARARAVGDRVIVVPATDRLEEYYGASDVFAFPTPYDAFGMVITEAMACGLPVITTRTAGAAELVEDGRTGILLADPGDRAGLVRAMRTLAADTLLRARIGEAAASAMEGQGWDAVAEKTVAVYRQVVGAGSC